MSLPRKYSYCSIQNRKNSLQCFLTRFSSFPNSNFSSDDISHMTSRSHALIDSDSPSDPKIIACNYCTCNHGLTLCKWSTMVYYVILMNFIQIGINKFVCILRSVRIVMELIFFRKFLLTFSLFRTSLGLFYAPPGT